MNEEFVRCPKCGQLNRVRAERMAPGRRLVCGECRTRLPFTAADAGPVKVTDADFRLLVESAPGPVFLDFWAGWCGPCLMIGPVIEELARELAGRVVVAKINIDQNPQTAARFNVTSIPTMIIFVSGREVGRLVGAIPKEAMISKLRSLGLI